MTTKVTGNAFFRSLHIKRFFPWPEYEWSAILKPVNITLTRFMVEYFSLSKDSALADNVLSSTYLEHVVQIADEEDGAEYTTGVGVKTTINDAEAPWTGKIKEGEILKAEFPDANASITAEWRPPTSREKGF